MLAVVLIYHFVIIFYFILWLAFRGRSKTKQLLWTRGFNISDICGICNCMPESWDHLFFLCPTAMQTWSAVLATLGISRAPGSWGAEKIWLMSNCEGRSRKSKAIRCAVAATLYMMWQERNTRVFQGKSLTTLP